MQRDQHAIEFLPAVLLSPDVDAGAQLQAVRQGMLVLGAPPDDEAHPGGGSGIVGHPEGQSVEPDYIRGRGGVTLLSGAKAKPKCASQRRRARMTSRKPCTFFTTASGGLPASTRSK